MKITKDTLRQLVKEELSIMKENGDQPYGDAFDQAAADAERDIDARLATAGDVAPQRIAQVKEMYLDAYSAGQVDAEDGVDKLKGQWQIKNKSGGNSQSMRDFYLRGHNDVTRIRQAPLTPAEAERAYMTREPEYAEGPYRGRNADRSKQVHPARERSKAQGLAADRVKARQAERGGAPYQALGDAAARGSIRALQRLQKAAQADPEAQAILDAVEKAKRRAADRRLRMSSPPPLSADQEADMLEQIIREEIQAVLAEDMEKKTKISAWEDWCDGKSKTWPTVNGVELKVDSMPLSLRMTCKAKANRAWRKRTQSR